MDHRSRHCPHSARKPPLPHPRPEPRPQPAPIPLAGPWHVQAWPAPTCPARGTPAAPRARMRGGRRPGALSGSLGCCCCYCWGARWARPPARPPAWASPAPRWCRAFFGTSRQPRASANASRCSWTLRNPGPARLYMKVAKAPPAAAPPASAPTSSTPFLESTRTYLGVESQDRGAAARDLSAPGLPAGQQTVSCRCSACGHPRTTPWGLTGPRAQRRPSVEYLVVGNRNPSRAARPDAAAAGWTPVWPAAAAHTLCGIMQTPAPAWVGTPHPASAPAPPRGRLPEGRRGWGASRTASPA